MTSTMTMEADLAPLCPNRSIDCWFPDGNVVLQVESTLFRVHSSILSMHSEVFQGMFSVPQPVAVDWDLVDNCPVVQLLDRAVDWTHVLKAFYSGSCKPYVCPFPVMAAYLRLGRKYEIEHLRTEALTVLSMAFPSTCDGFLALPDNGQSFIAPYPALFFDVIALAREVGKLDILPAAYFSYCRSYQINEVLGGIKREDGTLAVLSAEDQKSLLRGWHALVENLAGQSLYWILEDAALECEKQSCDLARKTVFLNLFTRGHQTPDISISVSKWDIRWEKDLCKQCRVACARLHKEGSYVKWSQLPEMFDLPDWNDLTGE